MPSPTLSDTPERAVTGVRANGRKSSREPRALRSSERIGQDAVRSEDASAPLMPAWVNASNGSVPAAYFDPRQALGVAFDIQEQMLTLQRKFWDGLLDVSGKNQPGRTVHQDPDELGFYVVEND